MFAEENAAEGFEFGACQLELIPVVGAVLARGFRLANGLEMHAGFFAKALEVSEREHSFHFDVVSLLEMVPAFEKLGSKITVVGEEDQAGCRVFEIANGVDTIWKASKEVAQGFAPFGIGESGDDFRWFVEKEIYTARRRIDGTPRGFNLVYSRVGFCTEFGDRFAVDTNLARDNELFGVTPGGNAGSGDNFLEAFEHGQPE